MKLNQIILSSALSLALLVSPWQSVQADDYEEKLPSIVEIALAVNQETGEFSTLIAAVVATDLVDTLNGNRQFTVFAPTDAAFAALGLDASNIGDLPKDALTNILLYHVSPGERFAADVLSSTQVRMMNKQFTTVSEGPKINDSGFVAVDVDARNGVIHVIDAVLLPD